MPALGSVPALGVDVSKTMQNRKGTEVIERKSRGADEKEERNEERNTNGSKSHPDFRQC